MIEDGAHASVLDALHLKGVHGGEDLRQPQTHRVDAVEGE